jgi:type II secretory pathway pseudopilin PulG
MQKTTLRRKENRPRREGFTLIELCIVTVISGLLFVSLFDLYSRYVLQQAIDNTEANIQASVSDISLFETNNSRYPFPADRTLSVNDPNYGLEIDPAAVGLTVNFCYSTNGAPKLTPAGTNGVGGVCMVPSLRDADGDGVNDPILIGAVPVNTLRASVPLGTGINVVFDGWGSKLDYAVSVTLTSATTFKFTNGVITAHDEAGRPTAGINDDAHYVVVSHGPDRVGAYSSGGQMASICNFGVPGAGLDTENCSNNSTFIEAIGNSTATGASHYDDHIYFAKSGVAGIWGNLPGASDMVNLNPGSVDMGTSAAPPSNDVTLNVADPTGGTNGIVQAENNTKAAQFCDKNNTNCFFTSAITGTGDLNNINCKNNSGIGSPNSWVMSGISKGTGDCGAPQYTPPLPCQKCPAGEWISGFQTDGKILCTGGGTPSVGCGP